MKRHQHHKWFTIVPAPAGALARNDPLWITLILFGWLVGLSHGSHASDDWPVWRGPTRDGIAPAGQHPPIHWDEATHVLWKTKIPGRGNSSPIIVGDQIFLTTSQASDQTQSVVSIDRKTGKRLWQTTICQGNLSPKIHRNNTHATPTIAATGNRLFACFWNNNRVELAALDHDGKIIWKKTAGQFISRYPYGYGASPCLYKDTVIVSSECEKLGSMAAFDQADGTEIWRTPRNQGTGYSSPIVQRVAGRDQLLISGSSRVTSYDPHNGKEIWSVPGPWEVTCGTMVFHENIVFANGGFPRGSTIAVKADGSGKVVWSNPVKSYEQSMLAHKGYIYSVSDNGVGYCWNALTGEEMWKQRLAGPVSASPILAGDNIYITTERGKTFVFSADPQRCELVAENQLGDSCFASLTIVNDRIYIRVGFQRDGKTQQWLYCLAR